MCIRGKKPFRNMLFFKGVKQTEKQGICFKICALCFLQSALCLFTYLIS